MKKQLKVLPILLAPLCIFLSLVILEVKDARSELAASKGVEFDRFNIRSECAELYTPDYCLVAEGY